VISEAAAGKTDPVIVDLDIAFRTVSRNGVQIAQDRFKSGRFDIDRVKVNFGGFLHKKGPIRAARERVNPFADLVFYQNRLCPLNRLLRSDTNDSSRIP